MLKSNKNLYGEAGLQMDTHCIWLTKEKQVKLKEHPSGVNVYMCRPNCPEVHVQATEMQGLIRLVHMLTGNYLCKHISSESAILATNWFKMLVLTYI